MQRLILFAKRPRLGRVKTRLVPPLSAEQALELYRALLSDSLALLRALGTGDARELELCLDGSPDATSRDGIDTRGLIVTAQGGGDLGRRLFRAFRRSHDDGAAATVVIGADAPTLPPERVEEAFARLAAGAPAVVAPAADGGYVLLGLREPSWALFREVPWGTDAVWETTRRRAGAAGLAIEVLDPWFDVDDAAALERLRRDLLRGNSGRTPATRRFIAALDGA